MEAAPLKKIAGVRASQNEKDGEKWRDRKKKKGRGGMGYIIGSSRKEKIE